MRRSLEFSRWWGSWWMQQARRRTGISCHLQEGLIAYAAEIADKEDRRHISWESTWASIRERAQMVLKTHLNDNDGEEGISIPKLTVEIDIDSEDGQEFFEELSDTD
jgi:hypothetical protein